LSTLSFIPLGVGDAFTALYYSSSIVVEYDGRRLLIDCPHPIRKMMLEAGTAAGTRIDVDTIDALALTHLHADHASGMEGFGYFSYFLLKKRAELIAHPDVVDRLWAGHLSAGMEQLLVKRDPPPWETVHKELADYFHHVPLVEDSAVTVGPFTLRCRKTIHHIPTTAFLISAGGHTLGYSADTAFDPALIEWLSEAELIIHETNYGIHTPYADLAALPATLRARMRLIHYPDDFDLGQSVIEPLKQGRRYTVGTQP